jgi:ppGpp synthetase/RelA/SpoT-type nucleotidyltranferase
MNFEEYERRGLALYLAFAETVAGMLGAAIAQDLSLHLQQVRSRAKDPASLRDKLVGRGILDTQALGDSIKDLAGCRVIFYTNADVTRFSQSGILRANFEFDDAKIHHPRLGSSKAVDQFRGDNFTVRLKPELAALPQYARFAGLRCEIQVQTILNHTWSEMAHDTIYKQPKLSGFGAKAIASIERRLDKVMREHLVPAGHDFQKISSDFARLMAGKDLFDQEPLRVIREAADNNERYDAIERLAEDVLQYYDDLASEHSDIVAALVEAAEQARTSESVPIVVGTSSFPGKSAGDVVQLIVGILRDYRYVGFEATTEAVIRLYMGATGDDEQKAIISLGEELAKHHLGVWKRYGPVAQQALIDIADKLPEETRERCRPLLRTMYDKILSPGVEGTEWASPDTLTISTGSVQASTELGEIRARAIEHLKAMLGMSSTDGERQAIISALFRASETPFNAQYSNELALLVLENAKTVVGICREMATGWSFEILQKLEDRMLRLHYANRAVPSWLTDDPTLAAANAALLVEILAFRDEVNADPHFVTYKTLVGYDSVFPSAWDQNPFDYEARDAWREERINAMVAAITADDADAWLDIITRCAQTRSDDLATFPTFGTFLAKLAAAKPDVVIGYLDRLDEQLAQFLPGMLRGLIDAGQQDFVERKLHGWMGQCRYLDTICFFLKSEMRLDNDLLVVAAERAALDGDDWAVTTSVAAAVSRYAHAADDRLKAVFLDGLQYLTAQNDVRWATSHFVNWRKSPILAALQGGELDVLFTALLLLPRLEYGIEELLVTVTGQNIDGVIQFLGDRMSRERELEADDRYRAVPFTPHKLPKALSAHPAKMVQAARTWFAADGSLFRFRGGHFIAQVFADMPEEFEAELRALVESGGLEEIKMALAILQNYEGNANIHGLCRDIIEALPEDDRLRTDVTIAIQSTGVVSGELGMAEAYEERKALVGPWLEDARLKVRQFAEEFIHQTDQAIAGEQRRAEEDREFRQRDFEKD